MCIRDQKFCSMQERTNKSMIVSEMFSDEWKLGTSQVVDRFLLTLRCNWIQEWKRVI